MKTFTMWDALGLALNAHEGQVDKLGKPYIGHVTAVARGVSSFGEDASIAALLHDVVEDTEVTFEDLHQAGVSAPVLVAVRLLTKQKGQPLREYLEAITKDQMATWVKIADNAHNTLPERVQAIEDEATRQRLALKYALGRDVLWRAVPKSETRRIIRQVNPSLEPLLEDS